MLCPMLKEKSSNECREKMIDANRQIAHLAFYRHENAISKKPKELFIANAHTCI